MEISDFFKSVRFMLDCGFEYGWDCYGEDACGIGWTSRDLKASAQIIYDAKNGKVYEATAWDDNAPFIPRWIRKGYKAKHDREALSRDVDPNIAIDKTRFRDVGADEVMAAVRKLIRKKAKKERK
jgi:hypothetical protein